MQVSAAAVPLMMGAIGCALAAMLHLASTHPVCKSPPKHHLEWGVHFALEGREIRQQGWLW